MADIYYLFLVNGKEIIITHRYNNKKARDHDYNISSYLARRDIYKYYKGYLDDKGNPVLLIDEATIV